MSCFGPYVVGPGRVMCRVRPRLMFSVVVLTVDQILRMVQ